MTRPGFRQVIGRAKWPTKLAVVAWLFLGALAALNVILWLSLGVLGAGWRYDVLAESATSVAFAYAVLSRLYWKGYARSMEPRATVSILDGQPTPEFLAAMDREFAARRAATNAFRR